MNAHVTLMSVGVAIIEQVKMPGYELSISPIERAAKPKDGARPKARSFTVNILKNGQPSDDVKVADAVAAKITALLAKRHVSERDTLIQDRLVLTLKDEPVKEEKKYPAKAEKPNAEKPKGEQPNAEVVRNTGDEEGNDENRSDEQN